MHKRVKNAYGRNMAVVNIKRIVKYVEMIKHVTKTGMCLLIVTEF